MAATLLLGASSNVSSVGDAGFMKASASSRSTSVLYYADKATNAVYLLDASRILQPPIGEITKGVNQPVALAVEPNGTLFVSNLSIGVTEYAPGATSPTHTFRPAGGSFGPVAVGADGTLAIACMVQGGQQKAVLAIYDKGSLVPTRTIVFHPAIKQRALIFSLLVDPSDNVYAAIKLYPHASGVFVIPHDMTVHYLTGLPLNDGMALDSAGNLYATEGTLSVYAPGRSRPFRTITDGLISAIGPAVTANGTIFVANTATIGRGKIVPGNIVEYLPGESRPVKVLQNQNDQNPVGAAFKPGHGQ